MSRIAYRDAEFVLPTLTHGVTLGKEIDYGLARCRRTVSSINIARRVGDSRALVVMQKHGFKYGLGIDEGTALVVMRIRPRLSVKGVLFCWMLPQLPADHKEPRFNWKRIKMSYLDHGDQLDLSSWNVTLSDAKRQGTMLNPQQAGFDPYYKVPLFSNDVLGKRHHYQHDVPSHRDPG